MAAPYISDLMACLRKAQAIIITMLMQKIRNMNITTIKSTVKAVARDSFFLYLSFKTLPDPFLVYLSIFVVGY